MRLIFRIGLGMFVNNYKHYLSSLKFLKSQDRYFVVLRTFRSSINQSNLLKSNSGFTLAEVLITVGILMALIGIVSKFLSSTSLNAGRFAARQESSMVYKVFKGDLLREIVRTSVNGNPNVVFDNHTAIVSIHANITGVRKEVTIGNFSYQNGCASSSKIKHSDTSLD